MTDIGIAVLRVSVGVAVAWLHGWHKVVEGWHYFAAGGRWSVDRLLGESRQ